MALKTRAELATERNVGIAPVQIIANTDGQTIDGLNGAVEEAHSAIADAETAVTSVEEAATLAEAQTAVTGVGATLGGAKTHIETVRPDLA